jgi:fluoride ion exporter CrcB/FEX
MLCRFARKDVIPTYLQNFPIYVLIENVKGCLSLSFPFFVAKPFRTPLFHFPFVGYFPEGQTFTPSHCTFAV